MSNSFKVHSICVVKNEGDIITHCLREALKWSDHIIVYDGESTDDTWEKTVALSKESNRVISWKQDGKVFQESLRSEVFNAFRHLAEEGDWWCHLDADEFYPHNAKQFLASVKWPYNVVWAVEIEYYLTYNDLERIDFSKSIPDVLSELRYYKVENSEPRFFRHRRGLVWKLDDSWPLHIGLVYPDPIIIKHFKYRSPRQIQLRLKTRQSNRERGFTGWQHASNGTWKDKIEDASKLHHDRGDNRFVISPKLMRYHHEPAYKRLIKLIMHTLGTWP